MAGFIGKLMLLQAAALPAAASLWIALLLSGLLALVALSRAGSFLFWRVIETPLAGGQPTGLTPSFPAATPPIAIPRAALFAVLVLLAANIVLSVFGAPISAALQATALQVLDNRQYTATVLAQVQTPAETLP